MDHHELETGLQMDQDLLSVLNKDKSLKGAFGSSYVKKQVAETDIRIQEDQISILNENKSTEDSFELPDVKNPVAEAANGLLKDQNLPSVLNKDKSMEGAFGTLIVENRITDDETTLQKGQNLPLILNDDKGVKGTFGSPNVQKTVAESDIVILEDRNLSSAVNEDKERALGSPGVENPVTKAETGLKQDQNVQLAQNEDKNIEGAFLSSDVEKSNTEAHIVLLEDQILLSPVNEEVLGSPNVENQVTKVETGLQQDQNVSSVLKEDKSMKGVFQSPDVENSDSKSRNDLYFIYGKKKKKKRVKYVASCEIEATVECEKKVLASPPPNSEQGSEYKKDYYSYDFLLDNMNLQGPETVFQKNRNLPLPLNEDISTDELFGSPDVEKTVTEADTVLQDDQNVPSALNEDKSIEWTFGSPNVKIPVSETKTRLQKDQNVQLNLNEAKSIEGAFLSPDVEKSNAEDDIILLEDQNLSSAVNEDNGKEGALGSPDVENPVTAETGLQRDQIVPLVLNEDKSIKVVFGSPDVGESAAENPDSGSRNDLDFVFGKKKKKRVQFISSCESVIHNEYKKKVLTSPPPESEQGSEHNKDDYSYDFLLNRVFNMMRKKNPNFDEVKKKLVIKPPQVLRAGTKKTSFANFLEICQLLHRTPQHVQSFLLCELGTNGSLDGNDQLVIKGKFQQKQIENVLRRYIREYVTCHTCHSAYTFLQRDIRLCFLQCEACGSRCSVASIKSGFQAVINKRATTRAKEI